MATAQQTGADLGAPSALRAALARIVRRLQRARLLRLVSRGAFSATCLSLVAVGLAHADLLPPWLPLECLIPFLLLLGIGLGALSAARTPMDLMTAARLAESRLGLKERLSSALDFERAGVAPPDPEAALLLRLQGQDAAAHAQSFRLDEVAPVRLFWETKAFLATFLVLLLALLLPTLPIFVPPAVRAERAVVQRSGEELARTARLIEKNADADGLPVTKRAAQDMQKLGRQMSQGRMDKKQAMVQMARLSKQMSGELRRAAQQSDSAAHEGQSLAPVGRQLAQSLSRSVSGQAANAHGQTSSPTPEMQRAAQALQRNSASGLSEPLRSLAQKTASRPLSPNEQRQTAQDLQKLSDALKGTPLSDAGKHAQSAADALRHGEPQRAASEMRQAAAAAAPPSHPQQDAQGVQSARESLQANQQQMAQAATPADVHHAVSDQAAPHGAGSASGRQPENGRPGSAGPSSGGSPQGGSPGSRDGGKSSPAKPGAGLAPHAGAPGGQASAPDAGVVRGAPHPLGPKGDAAKTPSAGRIFLGAGDGAAGQPSRSRSDAPPAGEPRAGSVPYYNSLAPARKTAETAMDKEDIPPAYRSSVRRYFDSLQPPAGTTK